MFPVRKSLFWTLLHYLPAPIIAFMAEKKDKNVPLSQNEKEAMAAFRRRFLTFPKRKTKKPVVLALIGLVGSGKTSVAREVAKRIGALVLTADDIRIELRKQKADYKNVRRIAEDLAVEFLAKGSNVIIDSDHIEKAKRATLTRKAKLWGALPSIVLFLRVVCDDDVMFGRTIERKYPRSQDDFFGGAETSWKGNEGIVGSIVKLREFHRRTPLHYEWLRDQGGKWKLRKLDIPLVGTLDTSSEDWKEQAHKVADRILKY